MAIQVTSGETQVVSVRVRAPTVVKSVTVGTPISSIRLPGTTLEGLFDVNIDSDLRDGDILTWVLADARWRNKPAEFFFDSDINALTVRIEANDSDIAELLAADITFASQITVLQTSISNLTSDVNALYDFDSDQRIINQIREDYDSDLSASLDSQRLDYIARDVVLQTQIDNFETVYNNADSDIIAMIDSNESFFRGQIVILELADSALGARIDSNYDLLQSIRVNLQGQTDSNETLFRNLIASLDSDLSFRIDSNYDLLQEIRANLQGQIDSNQTYLFSVDSNLQSAIDSNYGVFIFARNLLQAQIDSNEIFFRDQDSSLDTRIDSNYDAFIAALNTLQGSDSDIQAMIDSNYGAFIVTRTNLEASDSALGDRIDSNYDAFISTRNTLLAADSDIRVSVDSNYDVFLVTRTNLENVDSALGDLIDSAFAANLAADSDLGARIDSDYALLQTIRLALQSQIDSNETFFRAVDEVLRDADSDLGARVDSDYALLQVIRSNLQGQIDSNETFFRAADVVLRNIDSDLGDRIDSNYDVLLSERSLRQSADSNLQEQIDSNYDRLVNLTTTNVPEGSRLYYTNERVDDRVADLIQAGTGITVSYNDSLGELTISSMAVGGIDSAAIQSLIDSSLVSIQAQIDSDGADIQGIYTTLGSLQTQINSDGTDIQGIYTTLGSLQNQINSDGVDIQGIYTSLGTVNSTLSSLQTQINSDGSDIFDLTARVVTLENDPGVDSAAVFALIDARIDSDDFVKLVGNQTINGIKRFADSAFFSDIVAMNTTSPYKFPGYATFTMFHRNGGDLIMADSTGILGEIYTNNSGNLSLVASTDLRLEAFDDVILDAVDDIFFQTNNIDRGVIDNNGLFGINTINPNASSQLEIVSTTRGILIPRMTTAQKNAISSPVAGLLAYDNTVNKFSRWDSTGWRDIPTDSDLDDIRTRGVTGGGTDRAFLIFTQHITTSYTIDSDLNALTAGPIMIDSGASVTIQPGSVWTIV